MAANITRFLSTRNSVHALSKTSSTTTFARTRPNSLPSRCYASTNTPKTIRLEKPEKFVPPSHGRRLKQQIPRHYGPQLTQTQKTEQATKKYPHMMPPPGSWMFWFLTSKGIHTFISLVSLLLLTLLTSSLQLKPVIRFIANTSCQGILVLLASWTAYENWKRDTAFRDQLPSASELLSHPLAASSQIIEVYKLDVAKTSAETAEKRKRDVEDVQKRSTYRRAHGLESEDSQGLGGWTARSDTKTIGPSLQVDGPVSRKPVDFVADQAARKDHTFTDGDSKPAAPAESESSKKPLKKWFGIW